MMFDTRLPQPNDAFHWAQVGGRPALICRALEPFASHFFTTVAWELAQPVAERPASAWDEVADAMRVPPDRLLRVHQVHGAEVVLHRRHEPPVIGTRADIMLSDDGETALAVQAADCVPLLFVDRATGAVAASHAGWRGLAAGVPRVTVETLSREFGTRPADVLVAIGPSVGACCYEVGVDVHRQFEAAGFDPVVMARWFFERPQPTSRNPSMDRVANVAGRPGHWFFDSGSAAIDALVLAGIPREQVFPAELCTASHADTLASYRRDGAAAGRMAAAIRSRAV